MSKRRIKYGDGVDDEIYDLDTKEFVCSKHINDKFISSFIKKNGEKGKCDYCKTSLNVLPLSAVLELIINGIEYLFEDPANSRYLNKDGEHGLDGNTFDFYDLWREDYLGLKIEDSRLFEDMYEYLSNYNLYCYSDEYGSELDFLLNSWRHFKETVKHKARFVFHFEKVFSDYNFVDPISILNKVQDSVVKFDLIKTLNKNSILYRCRQHQNINDIKTIKDLASVPVEYSKHNGRMNPAGISMFYCSKSKALTINEVVDENDKTRPYYTTGIFRNIEELRLIDLCNIPDVGSVFDRKANRHIDTLSFLHGFVKDIANPIKDDDVIIEYVPTQIVTEYIRFNPKLKADGIMYPSSKSEGARNIVLFFNHSESMDRLTFKNSSLDRTEI